VPSSAIYRAGKIALIFSPAINHVRRSAAPADSEPEKAQSPGIKARFGLFRLKAEHRAPAPVKNHQLAAGNIQK
jgi:hypothetical protein